MDINNNTQTNIFIKGMNTDTSDMLLSPELYRKAVNLRLSTDKDGNDGELHMIEGTDSILTFEETITKSTVSYTYENIVRLYNIRDIIVAVVKYKKTNDSLYYWMVYNIRKTYTDGQFNLYEKTSITDLIPCADFDIENISGVLNYESSNNIYLYLANGINPILKVNLNGDDTLSIEDMVSYQNENLNPVTIVLSIAESGELLAGKVQYTYRVYSQHTTISQLSPVSNVISIYKDGNSGYAEGSKSSKAVLISGLPTTSRCQIFRIHYISDQQPPVITMIYDGKLTSSTHIDRGTETVSTLSLSEYTSLKTNLILRPKIIESKDEYLYAANIQNTDSSFNVDITGVTFSVVFSRQEDTYNIYTETDNERCFRLGETYRFGAIFYDKSGNKSEVIHIKNPEIGKDDWTVNVIPNNPTSAHDKGLYNFVLLNEGGINTGDNDYSTTNVWHANKIICNITASNIPNDISMIEIVRAKRNIENYRTISLGIIGNTLQPVANIQSDQKNENRRFPAYFLTRTNIVIRSTSGDSYFYGDGVLGMGSDGSVLLFSSPEVVYDEDKTNNIFKQYKDSLYLDYILHYTVPYSVDVGGTSFNVYKSPQLIGVYNTLYTIKINNAYPENYNQDVSKSLPMARYSETINENTYYTCGYDSFYCYYPIKDNNVANWKYYNLTSKSIAFSNIIVAKSNVLRNESSIKINDIKYINTPQYNNLSDGENFTDDAYSTIISNIEFIPFTTYYESSYPPTRNDLIDDFKNKSRLISTQREHLLYTPKATTGKSVLLTTTTGGLKSTTNQTLFLLVSVVDIYKQPAGYNKYCEYLSFGDYINNTAGTGTVKLTSGDCYFLIFEYNAAHVIYSYPYLNIDTVSTVYRIPICSYIDMSSEYGTSYTKQDNDYRIQDKACAFLGYAQDKSCYLYNPVYGDIDLVNNSFEKYEDEAEVTSRDATIYVSLKKENGEIIDNWLQFKPADFLDLSYKYGEITDLTTFNNQLIAWQKDATSLVSTNERQLVNSTTDTEIVLGTGGPLARYDYITTKYGMKENQLCHAKSNTTLYWWDYDRKELLAYSGELQTVPLTTIKNLRNHINSTTNVDTPKLLYDHKYKELISYVTGTESLVYNENIQMFTSLYDFAVGNNTEVNGDIFIANGQNVYQWNVSSDGECLLYKEDATPLLTYIINDKPQYVKTYDNMVLGGSMYGNSEKVVIDGEPDSTDDDNEEEQVTPLSTTEQNDVETYDPREQDLNKTYFKNVLGGVTIDFATPLNQKARVTVGDVVTINEHDFRLDIPRRNMFEGDSDPINILYGNRMRGKTMECTLKSDNNSTDFSLQYIITKYRTSWS